MLVKVTKWTLRPGPEGIIKLTIEAVRPDEDGSRSKVEIDLTPVDAQALADGLGCAILGEWEPS